MASPVDIGEDVRALGTSGYAVFDFDRTIVAIDTGSTFLWGLYCRSPLRRDEQSA